MLKLRSALVAVLLVGFSSTAGHAAPTPQPPIYDEKLEFDHGVKVTGRVAPGLQVNLILEYTSTNREVPGIGNLDGLPLPVMRPKAKKEVLPLHPGKDGRYEVGFRTLMKTRFGTRYMLRNVNVQVDTRGGSRDRNLLGTHVFFGQTGVEPRTLKRILVKGEAEGHVKLQLDGSDPDLSKYTFGLIPNTAGETTVNLDFVR